MIRSAIGFGLTREVGAPTLAGLDNDMRREEDIVLLQSSSAAYSISILFSQNLVLSHVVLIILFGI